eukprot:c9524_g1_i3.p1 GENE.c9524_g1_i3~~c9524_g1_i3.p1  ORF type:complete len:195 (-),score=34.71 c9524_g1_i3:460-1044(-)
MLVKISCRANNNVCQHQTKTMVMGATMMERRSLATIPPLRMTSPCVPRPALSSTRNVGIFGAAYRKFGSLATGSAFKSDSEYSSYVARVLEDIEQVLELNEEDLAIDELNVSDGVLTAKMEFVGQYIVNKHTPTHQIWLSSPKSGPSHYAYDRESRRWLNTRDRSLPSLHSVLTSELSQISPSKAKVVFACPEF